MTDHPKIEQNIKLAEEAWDAVSRSDVESLRRAWGTDTVWHVQDTSPWAGDYVGSEEIIDHLADIGESADDYNIRLNDILANDRHVIVLAEISARRGQTRLDTSYVLLVRVEGERIREVWSMPTEPGAVASFWHTPGSTSVEKPHRLTA